MCFFFPLPPSARRPRRLPSFSDHCTHPSGRTRSVPQKQRTEQELFDVFLKRHLSAVFAMKHAGATRASLTHGIF